MVCWWIVRWHFATARIPLASESDKPLVSNCFFLHLFVGCCFIWKHVLLLLRFSQGCLSYQSLIEYSFHINSNHLIYIVTIFVDGDCLSPENTSPYVSGNASPVESHHHHHHHHQQQQQQLHQQCYELPAMTAMNMTVQQHQQQPGCSNSGGTGHYSNNNSPVSSSYPGSVSPNNNIISSQTGVSGVSGGLNNNDFGAFSAYYTTANNANNSQQQQHYYSNVIQQQHSPDDCSGDQQQSLMTS